MKTLLLVRNDAGEGSRGGKIIGHTSGGKPIYSSANHPSHSGFSPSEHKQAARLHAKAIGDLNLSGDHSAKDFVLQRGHHNRQAALHKIKAKKAGRGNK